MTSVTATGRTAYDARTPGRASKFAIPQDSTSTALLTYSLLVTPDPLQVGGSATITLVVSNDTRQLVTCTSIALTLPVGTNAKDLISTATGLQPEPPTNWQAALAGGVITFTPQTTAAGVIAGDGLSFVIADLAVNAQPGTCTGVTVTETASSPAYPPPAQPRTATFSVPKFPAQFQVSELDANPLDVTAGGQATLSWTGSPSSTDGTYTATYTITYQSGNDLGTLVSQAVSYIGPYTAQNLTRTGSVDFTLIAQVAVAGQDQPLIVQRYASVAVDTLSLTFDIAPLTVAPNGLTLLSWTTANATSCTLNPVGTVATSGQLYVLMRQTTLFSLSAFGSANSMQEQQLTVTVDPTIKATVGGYTASGTNGYPGVNGHDGSFQHPASDGGDGEPGDATEITVTLSPLDVSSTPAIVTPITVTGGTGGAGGNGGNALEFSLGHPGGGAGGAFLAPGNGGNGAAGGNATLNLLVGTAGAATQYIITVSAGNGGSAGQPGHFSGSEGSVAYGNPGSAGSNGVAKTTLNGVPLLVSN